MLLDVAFNQWTGYALLKCAEAQPQKHGFCSLWNPAVGIPKPLPPQALAPACRQVLADLPLHFWVLLLSTYYMQGTESR